MKARFVLMFFIFCFSLTASFSCKKKVEAQYEDIIKKMLVDGSWVVTGFSEDGVDDTGSFSGWICKFYDNNTMSATLGSGSTAIIESGTWQSNLTAQTFTAAFASSVGVPLSKINGTWNISTTSATVASFTQTKGGVYYIMELTKY